jgi:putative membrane protein
VRVIYFLLLVVFVGAVVIFCLQNREAISIDWLNYSVTLPVSGLVAVVYLLGMLSGGSLLSFVRRSVHGVTARGY